MTIPQLIPWNRPTGVANADALRQDQRATARRGPFGNCPGSYRRTLPADDDRPDRPPCRESVAKRWNLREDAVVVASRDWKRMHRTICCAYPRSWHCDRHRHRHRCPSVHRPSRPSWRSPPAAPPPHRAIIRPLAPPPPPCRRVASTVDRGNRTPPNALPSRWREARDGFRKDDEGRGVRWSTVRWRPRRWRCRRLWIRRRGWADDSFLRRMLRRRMMLLGGCTLDPNRGLGRVRRCLRL
mmetsp:Transcript_6584/g.14589  ORF Transcript_6584/g.14589 Transcript_6584/m.14589 type:complete len:240 (-) Transcript_6584:169-888(-)